MSNTNAPFGFVYTGKVAGPQDDAQYARKISSGYTTAIFTGDPVIPLSTGYIGQAATGGSTQLAGVFVGCKYLSSALGRTVWSPYWPGSGAAADVTAYIVQDPNAVFKVQTYSTAIGFGSIGNNVNIQIGSGSTTSGLSGATVDQSTVNSTTTLPFRIVGLQDPTLPGGDSASAYNVIFVSFNYQDYRTQGGV